MTALSLRAFVGKAKEQPDAEPIDAQLAALDPRELALPTARLSKTAKFAHALLRDSDRAEARAAQEAALEEVAPLPGNAPDDADAAPGLDEESLGCDDDDDDDDDDSEATIDVADEEDAAFVVRGDVADALEAEAREEYARRDAMQPQANEPTMSLDQPAAKKRATHTSNAAHDAHAANDSMTDNRRDAKKKQKAMRESFAMADALDARKAALRTIVAAIASDCWAAKPCMYESLFAAAEGGERGSDAKLLLSTVAQSIADTKLVTGEISGALAMAREVDAAVLDAICELVGQVKHVEAVTKVSGDASPTALERCAVLGAPVQRAKMRELIMHMADGSAPRYRVHKAFAPLISHVHTLREFHTFLDTLVRKRIVTLARKIKPKKTTQLEGLDVLLEDTTQQAVLKVAHKKLNMALEAVCRSGSRVDDARKDVEEKEDDADDKSTGMLEDGGADDDSRSAPLGADDDALAYGMDF